MHFIALHPRDRIPYSKPELFPSETERQTALSTFLLCNEVGRVRHGRIWSEILEHLNIFILSNLDAPHYKHADGNRNKVA